MNEDIVARLRDVGFCGWDAQQEAADEIERLRADRDRWRNVAEDLVKAADVQVYLSSVPHRYPWYSQHLKDAIAQYKEAQK